MSNRSFQSDESDEGSIVSGLTNLYLGRAERNTASKREIPQTTINYREEASRMVFKQEPGVCQRLDEDQYSFYQTETNRSNNNFFNAKTSVSCYQNNNSHSTNNSLRILKLFQ